MLIAGPFADIVKVIEDQVDKKYAISELASGRLAESCLSPNAGLGDIYAWLAQSQKGEEVALQEMHICVFVSSYQTTADPKVGLDFIDAASSGRAAVNRLCVDHGIGLRILEMAPMLPHDVGDNWTELDCAKAVAFGMEAAAAGGHLLGISDMAPGNLAGKLAMIANLIPNGEAWMQGLASSESDPEIEHALRLLEKHASKAIHPLDTLRIFGGREVAACLGAFFAAKSRNLPVIIDGWAAIAAIMVLESIAKDASDHVRIGACGDALQQKVLMKLEKQSIIGSFIDAGPGCGSAVSLSVLKAAVDVVS